MMTDPIADMLTQIRNAQAVGKTTVVVPTSNVKRSVAELLYREGWLARCEERAAAAGHVGVDAPFHELVLTLQYRAPGAPAIRSIRRVSKPGRRVYVKRGAVPTIKRGTGIAILSTPQGIITNREAKARGIGGEVICEVY